jgi:hypothetical protein
LVVRTIFAVAQDSNPMQIYRHEETIKLADALGGSRKWRNTKKPRRMANGGPANGGNDTKQVLSLSRDDTVKLDDKSSAKQALNH